MKKTIDPFLMLMLMSIAAIAQEEPATAPSSNSSSSPKVRSTSSSSIDKAGSFGLALQPSLGFGSRTDYRGNNNTDVKTNYNNAGLLLIVRYGFTSQIQGELGFGFETAHSNRDENDFKSSTSGLDFHAGLNILPFNCQGPVDVGVLLGFDMFNGTNKVEVNGNENSGDAAWYTIGAGFRVEYHANGWFGLGTPVSVYINATPFRYRSDSFEGDKDNDDTRFVIFGADLFTAAGFTFWF